MKKKQKRSVRGGSLRELLKNRLKALENLKQLYEQNPNIAENVRVANIELVQNDIEALEKILYKTSR